MPNHNKYFIQSKKPLQINRVYQVKHRAFGTFTARTIHVHPDWCAFCVLEDNPKLRAEEFPIGSYIEISSRFFKVRKV